VDTDVIYDNEWRLLAGLLPADIEELAVQTGALVRRREIRSGLDLVRIALAYAQDDASLRGLSAWASEANIASLSDQAILKRLRGSVGLLREVCSRLLPFDGGLAEGLRMVLVDSTTVCRRRSAGTDFRVHVNYAASSGRLCGVQLTRADGGEALDRLPCGPGDLLVADQGYPSRPRLAHARSEGAHFAVRFYPPNLPLQDLSGHRVDANELCAHLEVGQVVDIDLCTVPTKDAPSVAGRLVAVRKTDENERRQIARSRKNSGKEPSAQTKLAARYVQIFTSLSREQADSALVLETYRMRWQVEMAFKRAKGVVSLGETAARDMELCEAKILAKLLLLLLIQKYETTFFPWGYALRRVQSVEAA
jgi:hypothetical protein